MYYYSYYYLYLPPAQYNFSNIINKTYDIHGYQEQYILKLP